jgi:hypothetical protein
VNGFLNAWEKHRNVDREPKHLRLGQVKPKHLAQR